MAIWLHDVEIYASLVAEGPGLARDWATTRLALYAPDRFAEFPDDLRCHDVVLAAAPPALLPSLMRSLSRSPVSTGVANASASLGQYGLIPEDTAVIAGAMRSAFRRDGDEADLWLAYGLSVLGRADAAALAAAARVSGENAQWALPIVLLRVAEAAGALGEAAAEVAREIEANKARDPQRLLAILTAMGVPLGAFARRIDDVDAAIRLGAAMAHQAPLAKKLPPGSQRRRHQAAVLALLDGVPGAVAALLRAVYRHEPHPSWQLWLVAVAAWLEGRSRPSDAHGGDLHDLLHHGGASDPMALSKARREVQFSDKAELLEAMSGHPDVAAGVLVSELVGQTHDPALSHALLALHGGDADADPRSIALACFGAANVPDEVPTLLASPDPADRVLGLVVAEWVPTAEVLSALLAMPVPARADLRRQYAWALAAMGDAAVVPHLQAIVAHLGDAAAEVSGPVRLAEAVLHTRIG
jgi:hypothetical protein